MPVRILKPKRRFLISEALIVIGIIALLVSIFLPSYAQRRDEREAREGIWNLSRIGMGAILYAKDHGGALPRTIAEMVGPYFEKMPVCPRAQRLGLAPPSGGPAGGFIYLRPAEKLEAIDSPERAVMAYEPLNYHEDAGTNVLFCDGNCMRIDRAAAEAMQRELDAGHNPPRTRFSR